jgi:hypothetical protein
MRVDLGEEEVGFLLDSGDDVCTGDESQRRLFEGGDGHHGCAELGGVADAVTSVTGLF